MLGSRKPEAKRFKKWATSEVLPNLRKHGRYDVSLAQYTPEIIDVIETDPDVIQIRKLVELKQEQVAQRCRLAKLEEQQQAIVLEIKAADSKADEALANIYGDTDFVSIVGYCSRLGIKISEPQSKRVGVAIANYCRKNDINYGSAKLGKGAHNERWDGVNTYPRSVLNEWRSGKIFVNDIRILDDKIIDDRAWQGNMYDF